MKTFKLGIAGTAKNTGKTTVTGALMEEFRERKIPFVLTSIGYDGEILDNITRLPKPRIYLEPGDMIVTSTKCMEASTAGFDTIAETDISTALGKIVVNVVTKAGLAVTAGPNKSSEVRKVSQILEQLNPGVIIFDGALNRIAPISETDGFILVTGASRNQNIPRLAEETGVIWQVSSLPAVSGDVGAFLSTLNKVSLVSDDLTVQKQWATSSWLSTNELKDFPTPKGGSYLYIPGIINEAVVIELLSILCSTNTKIHLVFANSIKLLISGTAERASKILTYLAESGISAYVARTIPLLAVTVNPFYAAYRVEAEDYSSALVDATELKSTIAQSVGVPVFDVLKDGATDLTDLIVRQH